MNCKYQVTLNPVHTSSSSLTQYRSLCVTGYVCTAFRGPDPTEEPAAPTWGRHQHRGLAAAQAVEQTLVAEVVVEQSHGAAELGQAEPGEDEAGLVAHEQGHRGPGRVSGQPPHRVGYFVALFVCGAQRVGLVVKHHEAALGLRGGLFREPVHGQEPGPPPAHGHERRYDPQQVTDVQRVRPQVRETRRKRPSCDEEARENNGEGK